MPATFAASNPALNVVVITIDTLRADHLGCYGYKQIRTPNIDALAGDGARFERAYTAVPVTLPSHTYFKLYKTQIPVVEQAIETAALLLGTDKSRGYCLEMICADFLAGANLENEEPTVLLQSMSRFFKFLPEGQRQSFLHEVTEKTS